MIFKILYTNTNGEQSFEQEGATIKDIKKAATQRVLADGGTSWRSERLMDTTE